MSLEAKRCGVKFRPPSIIILYENSGSGERRRRSIPVRDFSLISDCRRAAELLKLHSHHQEYLQSISVYQLEKLYLLLQDHLRGLSLQESLCAHTSNQKKHDGENLHEQTTEEHRDEKKDLDYSDADSSQDLNQLSDGELQRRKDQMDELFQRNRRHRGDPEFIYDMQVEFPEGGAKESCSWDEEDEE